MKKMLKIGAIVIVVIVLTILIGLIIFRHNYYRERNKIETELQNITGVKVIKIWGHEDTNLEEISALIDIENKGEIIITHLNVNDYSYPKHVYIPYIGGYKFKTFKCDKGLSISSNISIGENDLLGREIGLRFYSHIDVINNYDSILNFVKSMPQSPEIGHFIGDNDEELFVLIKRDKQINTKDPLYDLIGVKDDFEFAKNLNWTNRKCIK